MEAPFTSSEYPDYTKGDALELFISLKPVSSMSSVSRFCHHFVIFPVEIGGFYAKEMTHFRHDDTRPLFDPVHIDMEVKFDKKRKHFCFELDLKKSEFLSLFAFLKRVQKLC